MPVVSLARNHCGSAACPDVYYESETGRTFVVGRRTSDLPAAVLVGENEDVVELPFRVLVRAVWGQLRRVVLGRLALRHGALQQAPRSAP
jgi:hypothetical protein